MAGEATKLQSLVQRGFRSHKLLGSQALDFDDVFFSALYSAKSIRDFVNKTTEAINSVGISDWAYMQLDIPVDDSIDEQVGTDFTNQKKLYLHEAFYECDLMLKHVSHSFTPIFQSDVEEFVSRSPVMTEDISRNVELFKMTNGFGYSNYFYLPFKSDFSHGRVMLSVCSKDSDTNDLVSKVKNNIGKLCSIAYFVDKVGNLRFPQYFYGASKQYSKLDNSKAMELLRVMYNEDLNQNQAAQKLHVTASTAEKHMDKLRKSVGARTTTGAIGKLAKKQLI